jgi:hypothetical protein
MNAWLTKMNLAIGGKTYGLMAEQAKRISHCRLTFFVDNTGMKVSENGAFVAGRADSNEGGHLFQSDRGHHSNLMAASLVSSRGPVLVMS